MTLAAARSSVTGMHHVRRLAVTGVHHNSCMTMPSAPPVFLPPLPPKWVRGLRPVGLTLTIVGGLVLGAIAFIAMITLMSDPATPAVGFMPGPDGTPRAVVDSSAVDDVTHIEVYVEDEDQSVLWAVDRLPGAAWDGEVVLGTTPENFVLTTAPPEGAIPGGSVLLITNGCYGSYATVPAGPLKPGVVTMEDQELSLDEFNSGGLGFTPCGPAEFGTPIRIAKGALVLLVAGLAALVAARWRRTRAAPRPLTRRR
jgi:hypothetical protein